MPGTHQFIYRDRASAWPLRFHLADILDYWRRDGGLAAAVFLNLRRDLAVEQGQCSLPGGVILLTRCEPADLASASTACRHDYMIGRQCLRGGEPNTPRTLTGAASKMLRLMHEGVKLHCRLRDRPSHPARSPEAIHQSRFSAVHGFGSEVPDGAETTYADCSDMICGLLRHARRCAPGRHCQIP